jgi:hypothetical protein
MWHLCVPCWGNPNKKGIRKGENEIDKIREKEKGNKILVYSS